MNAPATTARFGETRVGSSGRIDLVLLPDGRIFAHNLTPALAAVLVELNPDDAVMRARAGGVMKVKIKSRSKIKSRMTRAGGRQVGEPEHDERRATNE